MTEHPSSDSIPVSWRPLSWGLSLVAAATLMLQIALTRIFSVTMWYHMSLVSVSMAMFGMTLGALVVDRMPGTFTRQRAPKLCALISLGFALCMAISLAVCLHTPFQVEMSASGIGLILYWNSVAALPFVLSGICVCVCLTRFPERVGRLYAYDLAGAALGCLAVVWLLGSLDAISAILAVAALPALAAAAFALSGKEAKLAMVSVVLAAVLGGMAVHNSGAQWLRIQYVLGKKFSTQQLRHQFWNVFSYITVTQPRDGAFLWGRGSNLPTSGLSATSMELTMDTRASSDLVKFNGDWDSVEWLLYDATSLAHGLRSDGDVLVIGVGGGRDVLSALIPTRGQRRVEAVEINPYTHALVKSIEAEFTGLAEIPGVTLHLDEARSWVERSQERFQVITIPLVDTSAASAAGAYALTENSLYTLEAFRLFHRHLTDDGVLSVSRWWFRGALGETHRLVGLAAASLRSEGVQEPRGHIVVCLGSNLSTLLISRKPYTEEDLNLLDQVCEKRGFVKLLTPREAADPSLVAAVEDPTWATLRRHGSVLVDVSPPTDDRPYFFHSYSLRNLLSRAAWSQQSGQSHWDREAMVILAVLVLAVSVLGLAVVLLPMWFDSATTRVTSDTLQTLAFFAAIGLGFMLFESAQMQRLSIFLGYPIYALTVVLFTLLLSSSLGASTVGRLWPNGAVKACLGLLIAMAVTGVLTPAIQSSFASSSLPRSVGCHGGHRSLDSRHSVEFRFLE